MSSGACGALALRVDELIALDFHRRRSARGTTPLGFDYHDGLPHMMPNESGKRRMTIYELRQE